MKFLKEQVNKKLVSESLDEIIFAETPNDNVEPKDDLTDIQYGVLNTLNTLMQEELDAIQSYNDAVVQCTAAGYGEFVETLKSLASEETVHLGELQKLYDTINGTTIKDIQDGQDEAQADLTITEDQLN